MQLSLQARKAVAAGLAASTLLWSAAGILPRVAHAAVHSEGCLVLSGGIVWLITGGTRRGFTSAEVFQSHGRNFSQVVTASAEDVALPVGPIMTYDDGTLVKGPNDPLVYLVANGQKRPFVSGSVFTGLGYSFANIQQAPVNTFQDLPTGSNLDSTAIAHPAGTLVISNGAVWEMTATGRRGFASASDFNSYGKGFNTVVAANSYDLAMANEGIVPAFPPCTGGDGTNPPPVSGSVNVSLSGPASTTLINDQSQATLADFMFSGSGTVTGITLKRTGISADSTLSNVYLFDGGTRITDGASVTTGSTINFTNSAGLFTVSGSKIISVKADMNATAGETVGVQLVTVTLAGGSTIGGLPVSGNNHSVATASLADVNLASALTISDTDPGNDIVVFQGNASVTGRDVVLSRLALRQIGSIQSSDVKNFRLFVDGVQVASQPTLDANNYVTFTLSKVLTSGTRVLKVVADITGGSGRNAWFSLRGAYDITVTDTQYNASPIVTASGNFPFGDSTEFAINPGAVTVTKASDSPSQNVTVGASDVALGKWTITAFGEAVKVETLTVAVDTTGGTTSEHTLRNGRLLINGSQYGSTTNVAAVDSHASGQSFTVNYMVNPGSPVTVEFRADIYDSEDTDNIGAGTVTAIQAALFGSGSLNNGVPQVSLGTVDVPGATVTANPLTVTSGSLTLTKLASYPNQTTAVPQSAYKLGQWSLNGNSSEAININTFSVGFVGADAFDANADLTNVYIKYGSNTSSIRGTVTTGSNTSLVNTWSQSATLGVNENMNIELWGSISSSATDGDATADTLTPYLRVSGIAAQSGLSVYADSDSDNNETDDAGSQGQTITASTGSLTTAADASNPVASITEDNKTLTAAAFKFTAASDTFNINELTFTLEGASTVSNVIVKADGSTVATRAGATSLTISGLNIPVSANGTKVITVDLQLGTVGSGAGTSGENVQVKMTGYKANSSSGSQVTNSNEGGFATREGAAQYVFAAIPTLTEAAIPNIDPVGTVEIAKWTVSPTGGNISVKQFGITVTIAEADTDGTLTAGSFKLFRDGTDITDQVAIVNAAGDTIESTNTLGEGSSVAYIAFATEEQISSARTYTLRTTLGGTWETGDSVRAEFASDAVSAATKDLDQIASGGPYELVEANGDNDTGVVNFIWSDLSAIPHLTTVTGMNDSTPDSSSDWTNGYLVKNLPLTSWSLNY